MQWSGVAGTHMVSAGRCCYIAEESPCKTDLLKCFKRGSLPLLHGSVACSLTAK
ncbi:TPA: hypothetical protein ACH3X1_003941 [Trebouxia sp. C0004]